jgi:hypothetical protein
MKDFMRRSVGDEDLLDIDPEALHPAALCPGNATLPTANRLSVEVGGSSPPNCTSKIKYLAKHID